ncbi:hypothetical protein IW262DRAFT_1302704 [Armillaria fumosa]|nr:hypothetical protein IW262DRAFT_1302704 [Armillaria fumosa]
MTLFFGYCDKHKSIQVGSVSAATDGSATFAEEETWNTIVDDWVRHSKSIPYNRIVERKRANVLEGQLSGSATFPDFSNNISVDELREMIRDFIEQQWYIEANRGQYMSADLPSSLPFARPTSLSKGNIIDLADYLKGCTITLFLSQPEPSPLETLASPTRAGTDSFEHQPDEPLQCNSSISPLKPAVPTKLAGDSRASIKVLWCKVAGSNAALPGDRLPSSKTEESRMQGAQGDGQNWEGNDGGIDIMSKTNEDGDRNSKAGDKELLESRGDGTDNFDNSEDVTGKVNEDGSTHRGPGAGRDGEDGEDTAEYAGGCNKGDEVTGDVDGVASKEEEVVTSGMGSERRQRNWTKTDQANDGIYLRKIVRWLCQNNPVEVEEVVRRSRILSSRLNTSLFLDTKDTLFQQRQKRRNRKTNYNGLRFGTHYYWNMLEQVIGT